MSEDDVALKPARETLKTRLATNEYQTLVDALLTGIGRLVQKLTRRSKASPKWLNIAVLIVVVYALGLGIIFVSGDMPRFYVITASFGVSSALIIWGTSFSTIVSMLLINEYIHRIWDTWHTMILDATESMTTLADFQRWLRRICNWRLHLFVAIIGGIAAGCYLIVAITTAYGQFGGYGILVSTIVFSMLSAAFLYLLFGVLELTWRLRHYELKLFAANPSASEVISRLSGLLSLGVYLIAAYAAVLTFFVGSSGLLLIFGPFLFVWLWLPITAIFILNQTSLSSIIRRVKWKTLNGIQAQVEALQAAGNDSSKETMEAINRLLDYHDRVKATRGSALDLRATLNFLNSLLLPLLGFLLANLDRMLALFRPPP